MLDAWLVTSALMHSTRLGRKHLLAASLKRAHDNAGFNAHAGTEGRKAMEAALQAVKEKAIDISSVPAAPPKTDLPVRGVGGQVVVHMLGGGSESLSNRLTLKVVVEQLAAKHNLGRVRRSTAAAPPNSEPPPPAAGFAHALDSGGVRLDAAAAFDGHDTIRVTAPWLLKRHRARQEWRART